MLFQPFGPYSDAILSLIVLVASWLLLRLEGKGLTALGFDQPARRARELLIGIGVTLGANVLVQVAGAVLLHIHWQWNAAFALPDFLVLTLLPLIAKVFVVALIFEGYLLLQALRFVGRTAGLWLAAALFGLYDCFALDAFGSVGEAVAAFLITGAYGFLLALAFRQTASIFLPMGLNFGWHFADKALFGSDVAMFEMVNVPGEPNRARGGPLAWAIYTVVIVGALGTCAWWLLRKDRRKGNSGHGTQALRTEG
jgi:membrane protease YdiL (CAAX protease family)